MADPEVRFPETYVSGVPVWAKRRKRSGVPPIVSTLVILLALFGAVMIGVSLRMGSVEKGGAVIDGWIAIVYKQAKAVVGAPPEAPAKVEKVATPEKAEPPETVEPPEAVETPETQKKPDPAHETRLEQSGRKGGRYAPPNKSSPVAESAVAR